MIPMNRAASILRGAAYGTVTPLDVIQRSSGLSRTWTRTAANRLTEKGFLAKEFLQKAGPGRPLAGYRVTPAGQKFLESFVDAEAATFRSGDSVAGPSWALSHYGLPLAGQKDAFVSGPKGFAALEEIPAPPFVLREPAQEGHVLYPAPERLALWLIGTGDERNVLLAPVLAKNQVKDWRNLWRLANDQQMTNRLAFVLHMSGQDDRIPENFRPKPKTENLVAFGDESEEGRRYNVKGTLSAKRFQEFEGLYGT